MFYLSVLAGLALLLCVWIWRYSSAVKLRSADSLQDLTRAEVDGFLKRTRTPNLVVGVIAGNQQFVLHSGVLHSCKKSVAAPDAVMQVGAVSALFTTALLQILVDEGRVSLDDTVQTHLGERYALAPRIRAITLRQLANHTSGLPRIPHVLLSSIRARVGKHNVMQDPYADFTEQEIISYLATPIDLRQPGKVRYSNYGMGLLGHVLEHATGRNLEVLLKEKLLRPLEMSSTGIHLNRDMQEQLVQGYTGELERAGLWRFGALHGAGACSSTATDLMKFLRANMGQVTQVSASLKRTLKADVGGQSGLGWMISARSCRLQGRDMYYWQEGQVGGYGAFVAIDMQQQLAVVALCCQSRSMRPFGSRLLRRIRHFSDLQGKSLVGAGEPIGPHI